MLMQLPAAEYRVPEGRIFTFPTRLADAYAPECLEIIKPPITVRLGETTISARWGRSSDLPSFGTYSWRRRAWMRAARPLEVGDAFLVDFRYETHVNISHLVTFAAPSALLARERLNRPVRVILRRNTSRLSLAVFAALGLEVLLSDRDVEGDFVVGSNGHDRVYEPYYRRIFDRVAVDESAEPCDRIYIGRRGSRRLENEDEVWPLLKSAGFRRLYFEDYTIPRQWAYARNAQVIVGLHGAALSSLVFNRMNVKLVELYHPGYAVDFFRRIVWLMGGAWVGVYGRMPANLIHELDERGDSEAFHFASTTISPRSLGMALEHIGVNL